MAHWGLSRQKQTIKQTDYNISPLITQKTEYDAAVLEKNSAY
jgi:hypothetical protein